MSVTIVVHQPPAFEDRTVTISRTIAPAEGSVTKQIAYKKPVDGFTGNLSGAIVKSPRKILTGSAGVLTGSISTVKTTTIKSAIVTGILSSLSGELTKRFSISKSVDGQLATLTGSTLKAIYQDLSGSLSNLSGDLEAWSQPELHGEMGALAGELTFEALFVCSPEGELSDLSGELFIGATVEVGGEVSPLGDIILDATSGVGGLLAPTGSLVPRVGKNLSGEIQPIGELTTIFLDSAVSLEGVIGMSSSLEAAAVYDMTWRAPFTGRANICDLTVEQGTVFQRRFRWIKKSGDPYNIYRYDLSMQIRPYAGATTVLAGTREGSIIITPEPDGYFTVTIPENITKTLDFTRAVYNIEAQYDTINIIRLIEGDIRLRKDANISFYEYNELTEGTVGELSGSLTAGKIVYKILTGQTGSLSGVLQAPPPKTLSGEIAGNKLSGVLSVLFSPKTYEGEISPTGEVTKQLYLTLSGELSDLSGGVTWDALNVLDGELSDLTGEVETIVNRLLNISGEFSMDGVL